MSNFMVGYAQVNINPPLEIGIGGYYVPRYAKGFLDDLEAHGIVLALDDTKIAMISIDLCEIMKPLVDRYRTAIEKATGIPAESCAYRNGGQTVGQRPGRWRRAAYRRSNRDCYP